MARAAGRHSHLSMQASQRTHAFAAKIVFTSVMWVLLRAGPMHASLRDARLVQQMVAIFNCTGLPLNARGTTRPSPNLNATPSAWPPGLMLTSYTSSNHTQLVYSGLHSC